MVTYNQKDYIETCINSIINQKTDFRYEILISDDHSSDGTDKLIKALEVQYPDFIRAFVHEQNCGPWGNYKFIHQQAVGEYIAHIDGDDYLLPGKLQIQADFLDRNPECCLVWHRMKAEIAGKKEFITDGIDVSQLPQKIYRQNIMSLITIGANSSKMYRASRREFELPPFDVLDYFANIEQIGEQYASFVNESFYGVYRIGVGIASSSNYTKELLLKTFIYLSGKYPSDRAYINAGCLILLLAELKNRRKMSFAFLIVFLRTFHYRSFYIAVKNFPVFRTLGYR